MGKLYFKSLEKLGFLWWVLLQGCHRKGLSLPSLNRLSLSLCCTKAVFNMAVGYFEVFCSIWHHCLIEWKERGPRKTFLKDFTNELSVYGFISVNDILLCLLLGVFFTFLRHVLTVAVFKVRFDFNCLIRGTQRGYSSKPLNIALLNVF